MKEIIVKSDGDTHLSIHILDESKLSIKITDGYDFYTFMDFTLEEIEDLQEAISIMKDRLKSKLSNITDKSDKLSDKKSDNVSNVNQQDKKNTAFWEKYNDIIKQIALGEKIEYKIGNYWYTINEIVGDLKSLPLSDCRIRKNK